jgi:hypothetical protein
MRRWRHPTSALLALIACSLLGGLVWLPSSAVQGRRHGRATRGLDCGACHTPAGWRVPVELRTARGFDHDLTGFPLRAGHRTAACTRCHEGRGEVSRTCSACHFDAHGGKLGQRCDTCHGASSFRTLDAIALHSRTRLPLTGAHVLVDCVDCHRRTSSDGYTSVPSQCFACHEADYRRQDIHPVHDGSRGDPPFSRVCGDCHRSDAFAPAVIDREHFLGKQAAALALDPREHDRRFALSHGPHRGAPCASCHADTNEPRWVRCTGCHQHSNALLAAQHPQLGAPADGSCTACHAGGAGR